MSKKIYTPTGLPAIQSQNSVLQTAHQVPTPKKAKLAPKIKENAQHSNNTMQGKPGPVKKNQNFRRIPSGHCPK